MSKVKVSDVDKLAIRNRARKCLGTDNSNVYVLLNDVLQKLENQVDWERKYRNCKRELDEKQDTIDKIYEFLE